jgi:branched-chain amino acid transport system substrate-binding protein
MGLLPPSWGSSGRRADPAERGWRRYTGRKDMRRTAERTGSRRSFLKGAAAAGLAASAGAFPTVSGGQSKLPIKIGMPTILSGRAAQIGVSSRNAAQMAVDEFNAAGGLDGRVVELVVRDSKGKPDEAARVVRELINADGCSIILDAEASSAAFAVQEVVRETGHLCIHTVSETSSLSADPKIRTPNAFRAARQGIHDSVFGGRYAAEVAKAEGLKRWMNCSPDYAYGRDTSAQFLEYLKGFEPSVELVGETWPKLFAPDYTENITRILQVKPQALYTCLYGGDLVTFIDQGNLYSLFEQTKVFAVNLADYTTLREIKNLPKGIHSSNRYLETFPATKANAEWCARYRKKYDVLPINWSWENAVGAQFLLEAMKKAGSDDGKVLAETLRGMVVDSPFGADGKITMRSADQTIIGYAIGWGATIPTEPFVPEVKAADWGFIVEREAEWKKRNGYA